MLFDALGLLVATATMGKVGESLGDLLEGVDPDPPLPTLRAFVADPETQAASMLGKATTRIAYDLDRFTRAGQPPFAATLARETHVSDLAPGQQSRIQISFAYSDGFGREIQKKIQAEPGRAPRRQTPAADPDVQPGALVRNAAGKLVEADVPQRWVGSGRTLFNNKAKPVKRYEPFFSSTHLYEPEADLAETGVSPILFYDPVLRVVATVHPDHTYEKVTFDPWSQTTYDVNDTVAPLGTETGDPRTDPDIAGYVEGYFETEPGWATWYAERSGGPAGPEADAATQAAAHANTPTVAHLDALGRSFMTVAHNRYDRAGATVEEKTATRTQLDVEGNELEVRDERTTAAGALEQRVVMRYAYDLVRTRVRQSSMEAGERWDLNDVGRQADSLVGQPPLSPPFHVRRAAPAHRALRHGQRRHGATGSAHGVRRGSGRRGEPLRPRVPGVRRRGTRDQRRLRLQGQPPRVPARPGSGVDPADELAAQSHCERRQLHDPDDLRRAQPRGHLDDARRQRLRADLQRSQPPRPRRRAAARGRCRDELRHERAVQRPRPAHADRLRERRQDDVRVRPADLPADDAEDDARRSRRDRGSPVPGCNGRPGLALHL